MNRSLPPDNLPLRPPPRRCHAFSLPEVAIALGIISFTVMPLMALMSQSFSVINVSNREVQCALIAQKIIADAQMMEFSALGNRTLYMDLEGRIVPQNAAVLIANVTAQEETSLLASSRLMRVRIEFNGTALQNQPKFYSATVAQLTP